MTGFASVGREAPGGTVQVTVKSVNHRFLDVAVKAPSVVAPFEPRLRALLQERLTRGRIELAVSAALTVTSVREVVVDEALVERLAAALGSARDRGLISGGLTAADLLRVPGAVDVRTPSGADATAPAPEFGDLVEAVAREAVDALITMRATEGRILAEDFSARLDTLATMVNALETQAREGQEHLEARLRERLGALPPDLTGDGAAVAREVVRFVSRSDIDEEIVRLRSHLEHWQALAASDEPCGRRLDFLVQEMNREVNTIGSKVESARATETVIAAKAELERIREQVQNVE
jgi:uncharacterized protein (TIGR00255 family)